MTQKKKKPTPASRDRVVYEVRTGNTPRQVEATSTAELKKALAPLLNLDPYSTQAAAHLAHTERATVTGQGWSIKRLGVLAFVPDSETTATPRKGPQEAKQRQEAGPTPANLPDSPQGQPGGKGGHHDHA